MACRCHAPAPLLFWVGRLDKNAEKPVAGPVNQYARMPKTVVIVESPAKAQTIQRFLGKDYDVIASFGHVRDLPESAKEIPAEFKGKPWARLGVNTDEDFQPIYIVPDDKKRRVTEMKATAKDAQRILLATDEDREGESISWHILQLLKPKKSVEVQRIVFHEITPEAIKQALAEPRAVDEALVRAQETRRILDRLYGYTLSPLLWKKVAPGLSAGRVQSVAVRLVVMRERERMGFVPASYSGIKATHEVEGATFGSKLSAVAGQTLADGQDFDHHGQLTNKKVYRLNADEAGPLAPRLQAAAPFTVTKRDEKPGTETPPPPFMTSTLQQEANRKFGFSGDRTMRIAQQLYEGVAMGGERVGLITYMRTDSLTLADRALEQAKAVITDLYGKEYALATPKRYKSKAKNAQEAHEAIRPTDLQRRPQDVKAYLDADQLKIYDLIWKRTLACQMRPAEVMRTRIELEVEEGGRTFTFGTSGKRIQFPGFLRAYVEGTDDPDADLGDRETILPNLKVGDKVTVKSVEMTEHVTRPTARYTEATLVRALEEQGIGRPSTYASIISTIQNRGYVFKKGNELVPTWTAFAVIQLLEEWFSELVDLGFTASMEDELDEIAEGDRDAVKQLKAFYFGTQQRPGIDAAVKEKGADIPFPLFPLSEEIRVRIGRNGPFIQRGEGGPGHTCSVPEDLPPADLTLEKAESLLTERAAGPESLGVDHKTGRNVYLKSGRYGAYLEREAGEDGEVKRVTLPPGANASELSEDDLSMLMSFPRLLGDEPGTQFAVTLAIGRYGAYLTAGERKANVGDWRTAANMTLQEALDALANPQNNRGGRGARSGGPEPLRTLGTAEGLAGEVKVMSGRYGPYVTDGQTNATLPKTITPEAVTLEQAAELLIAKAAAGPSKRGAKRAPARRGGTTAKKTTARKSTRSKK